MGSAAVNRPWPQMMKRSTAAAYCDLSSADFLREVMKGTLPQAVMLGSEEHWAKDDLDDDLRRLTGRARDWRREQPGLA